MFDDGEGLPRFYSPRELHHPHLICPAPSYPPQSKLQSRIADFFHAAEGDQNVAMQMYQAAVAESLQAIETEVQKTYSVTQRELMAAQQEHKNDAEVKALMTHLKQLFFGEDAEEMAPDPDTIEVPEGMTADM